MECNFAMTIPGVSRFRVNVFVQQQCVGMVIRTIATEIPNFEKLEAARSPEGRDHDQARAGAGRRRDRLGQVDVAGGDDRSPQPHVGRPHHHGRGPGRIRAHVAEVADHAPRGRRRHPLVAARAEEHAAPGARRDPDRRDPRRRDDGARDRVRRDRSPVPRHLARQQLEPDDRADHQLLPGRAAHAAADGPVGEPARDRLAAPGAARGRQRPRRPRSRSCSTRRRSPSASSRASSTRSSRS